ncbi:MAG: hypothetical protein J3K34DRAFT_518183 [Monoraphidium minutum]|nr:MAG: hypothetical protein J3K34DRAFT_518183 [Monoraphidium minutum]
MNQIALGTNRAMGGLVLPGMRPIRRCSVLVFSKKGFGPAKPTQDTDKKRKGGGKARRGGEPQPLGPQRVPGALTDLQLRRADELGESARRAEDEGEFNQRLVALKAEARERAATAAAAPAAAPAAAKGAIFDPAPAEDIYAAPPSLSETLMDKMQSDISDPALRKAAIGPDKLGLAAGAIVLGLVLILVSGADMSPGTDRYKGVRSSRPPPDEKTAALLEAQAASFKALLDRNPDDTAALESLAVTVARLGDYDSAADLLDKLVAKRPGDAEALRVLGEASLLSAQAPRAVAAYEKAAALQPRDQQIVTGLTDAYIASAQQSKAVSRLTRLRDELAAERRPGAAPAAAAAAAAGMGVPAVGDGPDGGASSSGGGGAAATAARRAVDPVAVQLLLGKTYAGWRGHDADAVAAYDALIAAAPEDFRGYLAKGVFLKERGRRGDAERMFLQAKFYAPDSMKAFVAARAGENALVDLPDNNS